MPVGVNPRDCWRKFFVRGGIFMQVYLLQLTAYIKRNIQLITRLITVIVLINLAIMEKARAARVLVLLLFLLIDVLHRVTVCSWKLHLVFSL